MHSQVESSQSTLQATLSNASELEFQLRETTDRCAALEEEISDLRVAALAQPAAIEHHNPIVLTLPSKSTPSAAPPVEDPRVSDLTSKLLTATTFISTLHQTIAALESDSDAHRTLTTKTHNADLAEVAALREELRESREELAMQEVERDELKQSIKIGGEREVELRKEVEEIDVDLLQCAIDLDHPLV